MVGLKLEPVKYKRFERNPVGCFEAHMTADGWAETKYTNDSSSVLLSVELSEFIRLVEQFFKICPDWATLAKYAKRYGTQIPGDAYDTVYAVNFLCDVMDYTLHISNTTLTVFPYRKYRH